VDGSLWTLPTRTGPPNRFVLGTGDFGPVERIGWYPYTPTCRITRPSPEFTDFDEFVIGTGTITTEAIHLTNSRPMVLSGEDRRMQGGRRKEVS